LRLKGKLIALKKLISKILEYSGYFEIFGRQR
jgi:hypothetical protein